MMSRQVLTITLLFLISNLVFAESYQLNANYFVRSSPRFNDTVRNRLGVLAAGSTFKVLEKVKRNDNSYAVRIQITDAAGNSSVRDSDSQWIYMSGSSHFTSVNDNSPPTTRTEAVSAVAGTPDCPTCAAAAGNGVANSSDIARVASAITDTRNIVPDSEDGAPEGAPAPATLSTAPRTPFTGALGDQIERYSASDEVNRMIAWAMANKAHSRGLCYRLVKEAMANQCGPSIRRTYVCHNPLSTGGRSGPGHNLIPSWFADERALSAKDTLRDQGFVNLLDQAPYNTQLADSPTLAPKGAILVYSSGMTCGARNRRRRTTNLDRDCGHIEIKTDAPGRPGYVSDYYSNIPITEGLSGPRYHLVAVMVKPGVQ